MGLTGRQPPTRDRVVRPRNAESLACALRRQAEPDEPKLYPNIGHFALLFAISRPRCSKAPVIGDAVRFIHRHTRAQSIAPAAAASAQ